MIKKWFPKESSETCAVLEAVLFEFLSEKAKGTMSHVKLSTDKFAQHPLPYACEEAGLDSKRLPTNQEVIFNFIDEKVTIKPLNGAIEILHSMHETAPAAFARSD